MCHHWWSACLVPWSPGLSLQYLISQVWCHTPETPALLGGGGRVMENSGYGGGGRLYYKRVPSQKIKNVKTSLHGFWHPQVHGDVFFKICTSIANQLLDRQEFSAGLYFPLPKEKKNVLAVIGVWCWKVGVPGRSREELCELAAARIFLSVQQPAELYVLHRHIALANRLFFLV